MAPIIPFQSLSNLLHLMVAKCATFVGTVTYMSPERIRNDGYSYPADIWSLGLALFECGTGEFPYIANEGPVNLMLQVKSTWPFFFSVSIYYFQSKLNFLSFLCYVVVRSWMIHHQHHQNKNSHQSSVPSLMLAFRKMQMLDQLLIRFKDCCFSLFFVCFNLRFVKISVLFFVFNSDGVSSVS